MFLGSKAPWNSAMRDLGIFSLPNDFPYRSFFGGFTNPQSLYVQLACANRRISGLR